MLLGPRRQVALDSPRLLRRADLCPTCLVFVRQKPKTVRQVVPPK